MESTPTPYLIKNQRCKTKLLSDLPANIDAFGSHKRLAKAIVSLINEEVGGKSIALTGTWGSGKSTVVNLVKSLLDKNATENSSDQTVFIFDAWSHERDPLRRAFLEKFIDFLSSINWINPKEWSKKKEQLSRRLTITETTQIPHLTLGGIALTFAALLVPMGLALLSTASNLPTYLLSIACFFSVSPILVILLLLLLKRGGNEISSKSDILRLLVSRSESNVRNETVETPDPTSIEFQDIFQNILTEALEADKERRILLVVDNLDRIDPDNALSIWSTMRTFFEHDSRSEIPWMSRFWLLVPFDLGALRRLWRGDEAEGDELVNAFKNKTFQIVFHISPPVLSDWKDFFIEQISIALPAEHHKSDFHLIYRIFRLKGTPKDRPITPRDIKLFINNLGALHRQWEDLIPLPSQALYILYKNKIESQENSLTKDDFLEPRILALIGQSDLQKHLASIHFNVEQEKAIQVLIGKQVEEAIVKGEPKDLKRYQKVIGFLEVCEHIIEENYREWASGDPAALSLAAIALYELEIDNIASWDHIWRCLKLGASNVEIWRGLNKDVGRGIVIILDHAEETERFESAKRILLSFTRPEIDEKNNMVVPETKRWSNGVFIVINELHDLGYNELLKRSFFVPYDSNFYLEVMAELKDIAYHDRLIEFFVPQKDQEQQIISELSQKCADGQITHKHSDAISVLGKTFIPWPWMGLIESLNQRLQGANNLKPKEIYTCIGVLNFLAYKSEVPEAVQTIKQLATHGHIAHHLHHAQAGNDLEAMAMCMLPLFDELPEGNIQDNVGQSQEGISYYQTILNSPNDNEKLVDAFTEVILKFRNVETLIQKIVDFPNTEKMSSIILNRIAAKDEAYKHIPSKLFIDNYDNFSRILSNENLKNMTDQLIDKANLFSEIEDLINRTEAEAEAEAGSLLSYIIEKLVKRKEVHEYISVSLFIEKYNNLKNVSSDEVLLNLIEQLDEKSNLFGKITDFKFSHELSSLYLHGYKVKGTQHETKYTQFLIKGLSSLQKENWLHELSQPGTFLNLMLCLVEDGFSINLLANFHDALREHTKRIIESQDLTTIDQVNWKTLLKSFTQYWKDTFLINLWDDLISMYNQPIEPALNMFGDELIYKSISDDKADEVIRRLLSEIIIRGNASELNWAIKVIRKTDIWDKSSEMSKKAFMDRVNHLILEEKGDILKLYELIGSEIGLDLELIKTKKDKSTEELENDIIDEEQTSDPDNGVNADRQ